MTSRSSAKPSDLPWRAAHERPEPPQPGSLPTWADRRAVLRASGASLALAGLGACDEGPAEFGHPLHSRPRGVTDEVQRYASVLELDGLGRGVLVHTRRGHAVKIEGNPDHPASLGATDPFLEAEVLSLYDPNRSRRVREQGRTRDAAELDAALATAGSELAARGGAGLHLLTGPTASPTTLRLIGSVLAAFPQAVWHRHRTVPDDDALEGARLAFGEPLESLYDLSRASAVLALGGGLLDAGPAQLRHARDWAAARAAGRAAADRLPALFVVEATPSLTGAKAARRVVLRPGDIESFARAVAAALGLVPARADPHPEAAPVAARLREAGPTALVTASLGQPPAVHALAHAINDALGSTGTTVRHIRPVRASPGESAASLQDLAAAIRAGTVTHLVVLDANPAHTAPAELGMAQLLREVPFSLHAGPWLDETALACRWHVPLRHPLESWGDSRAFDGTAAIRQPVTAARIPAARTGDELLATLAGRPASAEALVRETWRADWGQDQVFEERWRAALEAGVIEGSAAPARALPLRTDWDPGPTSPPAAGMAALFVTDPGVWDGTMAGNAWLQEAPRPLTKLVWGNAALLAPAAMAALALVPGDEVELELEGRRLTAPVWPLPGQAPDTVTLPLGYGRPTTGLPSGPGFDAYRLRPASAPWVAQGLRLTPTGRRREPVTTDHHHGLPDREGILHEVPPGGTLEPPEPSPSLYPDWPYPRAAWAMAIDLDACIGCNACVLACQAENTVPAVGPEEVARGREMHWLRVDRYHIGPADAPETVFQPVPCMHCEKAPCEPVCPVNATVHDSEGLNAMVYARCIGTRTCSNNCPYKVRRFNWLDYARGDDGPPVANPEVPRRPRGVMEKCTYCSHRIADTRARARAAGRDGLADGEVRTACQQACPTAAILFGDLNDPDSEVARARGSGRSYALLGHLDTRPRTTYLARVVSPPDEAG